MLSELLTNPWLIKEDALHGIVATIASQIKGIQIDAVTTHEGELLEGTYTTQIRDNVAIVPASGVLYKASNYSFSGFYGSYDLLIKELTKAASSPGVESTVLYLNSPGGTVAGCSNCASEIKKLCEQYNIVTYVDGNAASAAYWLASATRKIYGSDTAWYGSIGVVLTYYDISKMLKAWGIEEIEIVSSQSPNKRLTPADKEGKKLYQEHVDDIADVFIDFVAESRNKTQDQVINDFGQGFGEIGQKAVDVGLADGVMTLEDLISQLNKKQTRSYSHSMSLQEKTMDADKKPVPDTLATASVDDIKTKNPNAYQAIFDAGMSQGRTDEQARIKGLLDSEEAKDRSQQANHIAFNTSMSIDDGKSMLGASSKEAKPEVKPEAKKQDAFSVYMDTVENPEVHTGGGGEGDGEKEDDAAAAMAAVKALEAEGVI